MLWQQGNELAFEAIYKKYSVQLLAIAMQKTGDREVSQEIVQDTFITLFKNKASSDKISSLIAYLYVILKNRILDLHKHTIVQKKYEAYVSHHFTEEDHSTLAWIETKELEELLDEEIEKLPPQCRNVFKLSRKKYLSNKEIAISLEISENTIEQHMRKALRILRESLSNYKKIFIIAFLIAMPFWH